VRRPLIVAFAVASVLLGMAPVLSSASSTGGLLGTVAETLQGTIPSVLRLASDLGPLDALKVLHLQAPLVDPNLSALNQFVDEQSTPGSPEYHDLLTPAQFGAQFGAPSGEVDHVVSALASLGFHVTAPSVNRLFVDFTGPVSLIEHVFSLTLDNFSFSTGLRFFANRNNVTLPALLAGDVTSILGLNSMNSPQNNLFPSSVRSPVLAANQILTGSDGGASPCLQADAGAGYTAPDLAAAYNFDGLYAEGFHGEGMSAALVEFDDYHASNLAGIESCYGLKTPVTRRLVDGGIGGPPGAGEDEVASDISVILEMLPKLSHLYVYEAPSSGTSEIDLYDAFVTDDVAPVLSSSWGGCEELNTQGDDLLFGEIAEEAAAQGQEIFQAAGDSGAVDCRGFPPPVEGSVSTMQEASVPWVTGVGGTDLPVTSILGDAGHAETTWNDAGAGGGGVSAYWTMPSWQAALPSARNAPGASGAPCDAPKGQLCREVPDLSADADPDLGLVGRETNPQYLDNVGSPGYSVFCDTSNCQLLDQLIGPNPLPTLPDGILGWEPIAGTSLATPLIAAAAVLWNQEARAEGLSGLGFLNPSLYSVAANPAQYARDFHDITTDSNDDQYDATDCPPGCNIHHLYAAAPGYDMATGLGSINAANLGADLVAQAAHLVVTPDTATLYGYTHGESTTNPVTVSSGYYGSSFTATSDSSWLHVSDGTVGKSLSWYADPAGLAPGNYTGHISVTGSGGSGTLSVSYSVTPPAKIKISPSLLKFSERSVTKNNASTPPVCNATLWNDELTNTITGNDYPVDASTKQTLYIANVGPKGSVLHWSAIFVNETGAWAGLDAEPKGASFAQQSGPPLVSTTGTDLAGDWPSKVLLASFANDSANLNQGTYHGEFVIRDLADPSVLAAVIPATLVLGNGQHTPTIVTSPSSISLTMAQGGSTVVDVSLSDASKQCGYAYSTQSLVPWASIDPNQSSGVVAGSGPVPGSDADTGDGAGMVPIDIDTSGLAPGTYHGSVTVQSLNAEPNPVSVPITLTVTR
jgi:hypothetical protein